MHVLPAGFHRIRQSSLISLGKVSRRAPARARLGPTCPVARGHDYVLGVAGAGPGAKNTPVATPLWPLGLGSWAATCSFLQVPATTPLG
jgi:hypothetical protein